MNNLSVIFLFFILFIVLTSSLFSNVYGIDIEVRDKEGKLVFNGGQSTNQNRFEIGILGLPIIITYISIISISILFFQNRTKKIISKLIHCVINFEINQKYSILIVSGLVLFYIITNISKLWNAEEVSWGDYQYVLDYAKNFSFNSIPDLLSIRYLLHFVSLHVFGNIRVIAFIESISLVIVTYFLTATIAKKRFAGIIAIIILIQSGLFLKYSVTVTEDNLWTLFYVLSIYLVVKKWYLSPVSYTLSLFSKQLTAFLLPMIVFFTYKSDISKKQKRKIYLSYLIIAIFFLIRIILGFSQVTTVSFMPDKFVMGFKILSTVLRSDMIVTIFLLPLIVGLYIKSRKGVAHADSLMFLILGIIISAPLVNGVIDITNQLYRFIPLIVFFAIGVGTLFSNPPPISEAKRNYTSIIIFTFTLAITFVFLISVIFPALISTSNIS